jgi:hypothetical protein
MVAAVIAVTACTGASGGPAVVGSDAQISIRSSGPTPSTVLVLPGGRVLFTNDDDAPHQVESNPHPDHTGCPELDGPVLAPGDSFVVRMPTQARLCPFHDESRPADDAFHGVVDVEAPPLAIPSPLTPGAGF